MNNFEKAQTLLKELNGDGWLIACNEDSDVNSHFLLGVESHARHYIYVAANGKHEVLAVEMEAPMIEKSLKSNGVHARVDSYNSIEDLKSKLSLIVNKKRIALNFGENLFTQESTAYADFIRVGDYFSLINIAPQTEFFSAAPIIYNLRCIKSQEDLKDLRNVCKATIEILESLPDIVKLGMTEREIKAKIECKYLKLGRPSFAAIVGSGANAADPHHNSSAKKIESGALLIDTGLQIDQMCSDITWTFWVGRKPSDEFLKAYNVLYESKEIANKYLINNIPNNIPAIKCREYLANKGYDHEKLFFHGFGHSIGFEAHDIGARISWKVSDNFILKENMVYTAEPGLYWKDKWGVRLEDDIIIGNEKCEKLTYNHKEPITI
ncbi:MAG: M24 family metallopeptidase [Promethearchaeota archaeon]|jgi:Xaa-Pro aminopeptidase